MAHDPTKVLLGRGQSSAIKISTTTFEPPAIPPGVCINMNNAGLPVTTRPPGMRAGVSAGVSIPGHGKLDIIRTGERIAIRASLKRASGVITVTAFGNLISGTPDSVTIGATVFTAQVGAQTPGQAHFQAAADNTLTATNLASQINNHAAAKLLVYARAVTGVVTLYAKPSGVSGNEVAVAYTNNDASVGITLSGLVGGKLSGGSDLISDITYVVKGQKMYINDETGYADAAVPGYSTISDGTYVEGIVTGIDETGIEMPAVVVDMPGGL